MTQPPYGTPGNLPPAPIWPDAATQELPPEFGVAPPQEARPFQAEIMKSIALLNKGVAALKDPNNQDPSLDVAEAFLGVRKVLEVLCNVTKVV